MSCFHFRGCHVNGRRGLATMLTVQYIVRSILSTSKRHILLNLQQKRAVNTTFDLCANHGELVSNHSYLKTHQKHIEFGFLPPVECKWTLGKLMHSYWFLTTNVNAEKNKQCVHFSYNIPNAKPCLLTIC